MGFQKLVFPKRVPKGRPENSPAIYCWEKRIAPLVPEGRLSVNKIKRISRPSGTDRPFRLFPAMNRRAILECPFGTFAEIIFLNSIVNRK
jgi:hypothetical protein